MVREVGGRRMEVKIGRAAPCVWSVNDSVQRGKVRVVGVLLCHGNGLRSALCPNSCSLHSLSLSIIAHQRFFCLLYFPPPPPPSSLLPPPPSHPPSLLPPLLLFSSSFFPLEQVLLGWRGCEGHCQIPVLPEGREKLQAVVTRLPNVTSDWLLF